MPDDKPEILTRDQVLAMLSKKAVAGSVTAMVCLERALRLHGGDDEDDPLADELDRLLNDKRE